MNYHREILETLESLTEAARAFWNDGAEDESVENHFEMELVRAEDFLEKISVKPRHRK